MKKLLFIILLSSLTQLFAIDWLMLQGTELGRKETKAKIWGFVQPYYTQTSGTELAAGPWAGQNAGFNVIPPQKKSAETFNLMRARVGVRGWALGKDSKTNYFFLAEFGRNGITSQGGSAAKITDFSLTFNHIKGMRVRVGQFKAPMIEEGLQAAFSQHYANFTNVTNMLMQERYFYGDGSNLTSSNAPYAGVGAFRDIGIQFFDRFKRDKWSTSYAVMIGNGNGINQMDNDDNKDLTMYLSSERVYGGKMGGQKGLKFFGWYNTGKRTLTKEGAGEYDRKRHGLGTTYDKGKFQAAAEFIWADGMIYSGTDGGAVAGAVSNDGTKVSSNNVNPNDKADGFYVDFGFRPKKKWLINTRYDVYNRATETDSGERKFTTLTVGAQYTLYKKSVVMFNYEFRSGEAPALDDSATANMILDGMDDRLTLRYSLVF